jgi:hypothetical protein
MRTHGATPSTTPTLLACSLGIRRTRSLLVGRCLHRGEGVLEGNGLVQGVALARLKQKHEEGPLIMARSTN